MCINLNHDLFDGVALCNVFHGTNALSLRFQFFLFSLHFSHSSVASIKNLDLRLSPPTRISGMVVKRG